MFTSRAVHFTTLSLICVLSNQLRVFLSVNLCAHLPSALSSSSNISAVSFSHLSLIDIPPDTHSPLPHHEGAMVIVKTPIGLVWKGSICVYAHYNGSKHRILSLAGSCRRVGLKAHQGMHLSRNLPFLKLVLYSAITRLLFGLIAPQIPTRRDLALG